MALRTLYTGGSTTVTTSATLLKNTGHAAVHLVTLGAIGAFAGARLVGQIGASAGSTRWISVSGAELAATDTVNVEIADGWYFRTVLCSASATATSVDAWYGVAPYSR